MRWLFLLLAALASPAAAQTALFAPSAAKTADLTPRQAEIFGILSAELGVEAVEIVRADVSALTAADVIELAFPGESFVLETVSTTRRASGVVSWVGQTDAGRRPAAGDVLVTLAARDGMVTGSVRRGGYLYEVRPLTDGLHAIARKSMAEYRLHDDDGYDAVLDAAAPPEAGGGADHGTENGAASGAALGAAAMTVDVLFPYTTNITAAFADPGALAQTFVDYANQVYANSAVDVALRLVYTYETPYASAGTQQDLYDVTDGPDLDVSTIGPYTATAGKMDDVHANRDAYGADLVVLLSGTNTSGLCGIAWVNSSARTGFSANSASCGASTIVHEIGHNFGSNHDRFTDNDDTPGDGTNDPVYPYGRGYVNQAGDWTTVMGYNAACDDDGTPGAPPFSALCEVIPHLSNPNVTYTDTSTPVASGPTGDAATADNARLHQERRATIASFRAAGSPPALVYGPGSFNERLAVGGTSAQTLTIENTATAADALPVNWTLQLNETTSGARPAKAAGVAQETAHAVAVPVSDELAPRPAPPPEASGGTSKRVTDCTDGQEFGNVNGTTTLQTASVGPEYGQSFTAACTGRIEALNLWVRFDDAPGATWSPTIRFYQGEGTGGTQVYAVNYSTITNGSAGTVFYTFGLPTPLDITEGQVYTWFVDLRDGNTAVRIDPAGNDPGGQLYTSANGAPGSATAVSGSDARYRVRTLAPTTPSLTWVTISATSGSVPRVTSEDVTVSFDASGLAAGTYTADLTLTSNDPTAVSSVIPITLLVDTGAETATIDGAEGWRLFAPAAPGLTVDDLAALNYVGGIPDYTPDFGAPTLYTGYDGTDYATPAGGSDVLASGAGFWWYLFDTNYSDGGPSDSYALPFTLATPLAPATADAIVPLHADGNKVNMLGNPFGQSLDLSGAASWTGADNLQTPVFATYDSGLNTWGYSTATPVVSAWQGFFAYGQTAGALTIPASARTTGGTLLKGTDDERIFLALELDEATPLAPEDPLADRGAILYFDDSAGVGKDAFDLPEMEAVDSRHLTLAFGVEEASGATALRGHEGRSPEDGAVEVPLHVGAAGSSPNLVLSWPTVDRLPAGWTATLLDEETGRVVDLRAQASYAFEVEPQEVAPAASATLAPPASKGALAKSPEAAARRFTLRVTPAVTVAGEDAAAVETGLGLPQPNPTRSGATLRYSLAEPGAATLAVYDARGREVARLAEGAHMSGAHEARWDTAGLAAGVYVVRLVTVEGAFARRAVVAR